MANDLAPGFVQIHYASPLAEHVMTLGAQPFQDIGGNWLLTQPGVGPGVAWATGVNALVTVLKTKLNADTTFTFADLFTKGIGAAPTFRASATLSVAGTSGSGRISASQVTYSYRSSTGGRGKVILVDQTDAVNQKFRATGYGDAAKLAVVNYLIGGTNWVTARDGGFPINVVQILTKTNDVLRKKYGIS